MRFVYSPLHLGHDIRTQTILGVQVEANEVAERAEVIRSTLLADGGFEAVGPTEHGAEPITAVHDPGLLRSSRRPGTRPSGPGHPYDFLAPGDDPHRAATEGMRAGARHETTKIDGRAGYWALDTSTYIVEGTYAAARAAVDVALTTVDLVLGGERAAYGLCRPPGHHAARSMYGGFCYFNNAAIAAEAIAEQTGEHVSILDVDFHHGNGTEQIFWRRGDVLYVGLHAHPDRQYPYVLGWEEETGKARATARTSTSRCPRRVRRGVPGGPRPGPRADRGRARATWSSSRSASTPTARTRSATSRSRRPSTTSGRRAAALGKRLVILQEGGYHVATWARTPALAARRRGPRLRPSGDGSTPTQAAAGVDARRSDQTSTTFSARSRAAWKAVLATSRPPAR